MATLKANLSYKQYQQSNHSIMSAKAFFNDNDGTCRLEITFHDGRVQSMAFESTSSLVNYCRDLGIPVSCGCSRSE